MVCIWRKKNTLKTLDGMILFLASISLIREEIDRLLFKQFEVLLKSISTEINEKIIKIDSIYFSMLFKN